MGTRQRSPKGVWIKSGTSIYWFSYTDPITKVRHFKSTGTSDKKMANDMYYGFMAELVKVKHFGANEAQNRTFDEMMEKFMREHSITQEPTTQKRYISLLSHLQDFFEGMTLAEITTGKILEYVAKRRTEKKIIKEKQVPSCTAATRNRELAMLSKAFNLARLWNWTKENPCSLVPREDEENENIGRAMTIDEENLLLPICTTYLHGQLSEMVILAINTGIRQGELINLTWEQIDLFKKAFMSYNEKTNEWHGVAMNDTIYGLLKEKAKSDNMVGHIFRSENGTPYKPRIIQRAWRAAQKKAGIENHLRWHDLRHTFGCRMAEAGVDIHTLATAMDHSQLSTTRRYSKHSVESLRRAVNKIDNYSQKKAQNG